MKRNQKILVLTELLTTELRKGAATECGLNTKRLYKKLRPHHAEKNIKIHTWDEGVRAAMAALRLAIPSVTCLACAARVGQLSIFSDAAVAEPDEAAEARRLGCCLACSTAQR
jgi:hypothetical protein